MMNQMTNWARRIAVSAMVMGLAGCQEGGSSGAKVKSENSASGARSESPHVAPAQQPVVQTAAHGSATDPPSKAPAPVEDFESDASKRAQAENMIYATIRIKMEEAIEGRAKLLKSGKDPADVEVRQLEGTIMRARELLEENGEVVEPVEPPIVQNAGNP